MYIICLIAILLYFYLKQRLLYKLRSRYPAEIDATQLQQIIRSIYCGTLRSLRTIGGPSLDLCRALLALRDPGLGGRLSLDYVPVLINLLKFWKVSANNVQCIYKYFTSIRCSVLVQGQI